MKTSEFGTNLAVLGIIFAPGLAISGIVYERTKSLLPAIGSFVAAEIVWVALNKFVITPRVAVTK